MANTLFVGKVYHRFDELPSTNDYMRELLAKSKPAEGTAVRAAGQSAGHGQFGSRWLVKPHENLTISILFYPRWLSAPAQFRLNEAVALALLQTVEIAAPALTPQIKWPNDLYLGGKKTAGMLIRNTLGNGHLQSAIVGIGLNVNQIQFPDELPNATSLALQSGQHFDLDTLADTLFECLEHRYLQLRAGKTDALRQEYREHLLGLGVRQSFNRPDGRVFEGTIQGVAEDGRLCIQTGGALEYFALKEVAMPV